MDSYSGSQVGADGRRYTIGDPNLPTVEPTPGGQVVTHDDLDSLVAKDLRAFRSDTTGLSPDPTGIYVEELAAPTVEVPWVEAGASGLVFREPGLYNVNVWLNVGGIVPTGAERPGLMQVYFSGTSEIIFQAPYRLMANGASFLANGSASARAVADSDDFVGGSGDVLVDQPMPLYVNWPTTFAYTAGTLRVQVTILKFG
jgi:hypothetical protein